MVKSDDTKDVSKVKKAKKKAKIFDHVSKIKKIPKAPGIYIMKDHQDRIVYIGKSVNLKARVRSYFSRSDPRPFVKRLPKILSDIEFVVAPSEKDALILEARMISKHKPRYNILLREEKAQMYLRVDRKSPWPRIEYVRWMKRDGARYFGPYTSSYAIRQALHVLNRHFKLRTCPDSVFKNRTRPCLQYQIKRCLGPCAIPVEDAVYDEHVQEAILFLEGKQPELKGRLNQKMESASEELEFELAAHYRDQIRAIDSAITGQEVKGGDFVDQDVLGLYREGARVAFHLLYVRRGKLVNAKAFTFKDQEFPDHELCSSFLNLYYSQGNQLPDEILIPTELEDEGAIGQLLTDLKGRKVQVMRPTRGPRLKLVETANINARHTFQNQQTGEDQRTELLASLERKLKLSRLPQRIECFDISNFQGKPIVGSMVVFEDCEPNKKAYRTFKVKSVQEQDDFASMYEVLKRRFERTLHGDWPKPDLVVVDGGKGQLKQAVTVLSDLGIYDVDVISLAKSRVESAPQSERVDKSLERVFLPGRKNPVILKQNSSELYLLQRVRDEAHNHAITFHRKLRRKQTMRSSLEDVPGVGPARRKALLKHFGSLQKIRDARAEDLLNVPGISKELALKIAAHLKASGSQNTLDLKDA